MTHIQQGDVLLAQGLRYTDTYQEWLILVDNGVVHMTGGIGNAVVLSLFGGNLDDDATPNNPDSYWGNLIEQNPSYHYHSRTQYVLQSIPATTANLLLVVDAVKQDLAWLLTEAIANTVDVSVTMPALNRIKIDVHTEARGREENFSFVPNWKAAAL